MLTTRQYAGRLRRSAKQQPSLFSFHEALGNIFRYMGRSSRDTDLQTDEKIIAPPEFIDFLP